MSVLRIQNLSKDYHTGWGKTLRALNDLSLEVEEGEIFGFLGPNGAGKTTTIKILLSIIFPTKGKAWLLDKEIGDALLMHKIGYMPENPYFYRFLTGEEFLLFYAQLSGMPREDAKKKAARLLEVVNLKHAAKVRIAQYSKGMVTRVGLAQALITDPALLLLDEPMSGLDPIGRKEIRNLIHQLKEEKKTIFFCSHILADIEMLCNRIAILNKGDLVKLGTVSEILDSGPTHYTVTFDNLSPQAFEQVKGMAAECQDYAGVTHFNAKDRSHAQQLIDAATGQGAELREMRLDRGTLEEYFVREVGRE